MNGKSRYRLSEIHRLGCCIATLLIDADQVQPGKIDPTTGAIVADSLCNPKIDDKLDDLAELVLKMGGDVVVVPTDRMPTQTGLAAIYRYA